VCAAGTSKLKSKSSVTSRNPKGEPGRAYPETRQVYIESPEGKTLSRKEEEREPRRRKKSKDKKLAREERCTLCLFGGFWDGGSIDGNDLSGHGSGSKQVELDDRKGNTIHLGGVVRGGGGWDAGGRREFKTQR